MKNLVVFLLVSFLGAAVWAAQPMSLGGDDDLFPWPWGTECPFPWQEVEGIYLVKAVKLYGTHANHYLRVSVSQKDASGLEFLTVDEYDQAGYPYASGQGYAQENERIVKGLLKETNTGRTFTVMVRSYARQKSAGCSSDLVTAVTFCPLRGKKCMSDASYILERIK